MTPSRLRRHDPGEKHTNKGRPGHEESKMIRTMITDRLVNRNEEIICGRPPRKRAESYSHLLPLSLAANLPRAQHRGHESLRAALASAVSRRFRGARQAVTDSSPRRAERRQNIDLPVRMPPTHRPPSTNDAPASPSRRRAFNHRRNRARKLCDDSDTPPGKPTLPFRECASRAVRRSRESSSRALNGSIRRLRVPSGYRSSD